MSTTQEYLKFLLDKACIRNNIDFDGLISLYNSSRHITEIGIIVYYLRKYLVDINDNNLWKDELLMELRIDMGETFVNYFENDTLEYFNVDSTDALLLILNIDKVESIGDILNILDRIK